MKKFITSILTLLLVVLATPSTSATSTSATDAMRGKKSISNCDDEDEVLKAAVVATIVRKIQAAVFPFTQGTNVEFGAIVSEAFKDKVTYFEMDVGNGDGELDPIEIILFFQKYYEDKCAADLLEMFSVLPDAPPAPLGPK